MKTAELSTKEALILEAQRLLQTRGFDSFSFQDLADKVGIRKASVHAHFKDKEELGVKLIEKYISDFHLWLDYVSKRTAVEQLLSFGRMVKKIYSVGEHLCVNGSCLADWGMLPPKMQKRSLELQTIQLDWMTRSLEAAREAGDLKFEGSARARAQQMFVTILGSLQTARAWNNPDLFDSIFKTCFADLGWKEKK